MKYSGKTWYSIEHAFRSRMCDLLAKKKDAGQFNGSQYKEIVALDLFKNTSNRICSIFKKPLKNYFNTFQVVGKENENSLEVLNASYM